MTTHPSSPGAVTAIRLDPTKGRFIRRRMQIRRLYRSAFPRYERKPFSIILSMWRKGKTDVWVFERDGRFVGFTTTINGDGVILLDYLAVSPSCRGDGVGSQMLRELLSRYSGNGVFVEIESVENDAANSEERKCRKHFYNINGFEAMGVTVLLFGTKMELMGHSCRLTLDTYRAFYRDHYSPMAAEHIKDAESL